MTFIPRILEDSTILATVHTEARTVGNASLLSLSLPTEVHASLQTAANSLAGRYFLARCCEPVQKGYTPFDGPIYYRRSLFVAGQKVLTANPKSTESLWTLIVPHGPDAGYQWLHQRQFGAWINLLGPFGNGFQLQTESRNLLLMADLSRVCKLLPLIEQMLDRGGRVMLLLNAAEAGQGNLGYQSVIANLPLAVEVRLTEGASWVDGWQPPLAELLRWADQLCVAAELSTYQPLAYEIKQHRFRLEDGFAQVLVDADLLCGVGACLACVVPTANGGLTRTCVHGPVLDLKTLSA